MLRIAALVGSLALLTLPALAQDAPSGIKRMLLQSVAFPDGFNTVTGLAELAPGASAGAHTHPGVETGYILEGEVLMSVEGQPDVTLKAGDSYSIPAGARHDVRTVGDAATKVIATWVVDKSKPMASPAP